MTGWQRWMLEVVRRIAGQAQALHHPLRAHVGSGRERHDAAAGRQATSTGSGTGISSASRDVPGSPRTPRPAATR
jgi:hypothetical protein